MARRSRAVASRSRMPSGSREVSGPTMRRALRFRGPSPQVHARCDGAGGRRSSDASSWGTVSRLRGSKSLSKTRPRARVSGILQDEGPAAIPFSTVRKSGFPEIFRSDPGGAGVDERILGMEESIAFHDVLPACHPADVDTGRGEPAAHIVCVAVDASDRTSVEEDADADAPTGGVPEDGCDPLARECIDAHLDRPFGGREESEQGTVPGIRREDRRESARQLEFAEAERGLSQSMAARALPVLRSIPVDPFAARRAEADRDLAPPHLLRGPGGPT